MAKGGCIGNKDYYNGDIIFDIKKLAILIKQYRKEKNITQQVFSEIVQVSQPTISCIENKKNNKIDVVTVEKICILLNIPICDVMIKYKSAEIDLLNNRFALILEDAKREGTNDAIEECENALTKVKDAIKGFCDMQLAKEYLFHLINVDKKCAEEGIKKSFLEIYYKLINAKEEYEKVVFLNIIMEQVLNIIPVPVFDKFSLPISDPLTTEDEGVLGFQYNYTKTIEKFPIAYDYMIKVTDDSMDLSDIKKGDFVIIKATSTPEPNDIVIFNLHGESFIREYIQDSNNVVFTPHSNNLSYHPLVLQKSIAEFVIIGKIVGVQRFR